MSVTRLLPHSLEYAERIFELTSHSEVNEHLSFKDESVEQTREFIQFILAEEQAGKAVSRVIFNEHNEVIGTTTLMNIDRENGQCHIGSWIGRDYWGQGYNQSAKEQILKIAFEELGLERVFAGARKVNVRSQKAQEKIPYFTLHVEKQFPEEHEKLERKENTTCVLNVVHRENFLNYLQQKK